MAGDEGRSKDETSDDLFEDLDKFFAPIQDVEWPETAPEEEASSGAPAKQVYASGAGSSGGCGCGSDGR